MSVIAADLQVYGSASMPEDDTTGVGGAVDLAVKIVFTDLSADDTVDLVGDDVGDTDQVYRLHGFSASGARQTEDYDAAGTSTVAGSKTFERINKAERLSGSALDGTMTFKKHSGGATLITIEGATDAGAGTEITEVRKPFYNAASDPDATKTLYEKVFFRNNNATITLVDAIIAIMDAPVKATPTAVNVDQNSASGQKVLYVDATTGFSATDSVIIGSGTARQESGLIASVDAGVSVTLTDNLKFTHTSGQADAMAETRVTCDVEAPLNGTDTATNRITAPSGYGYAFDCSDHPVANLQNHTAGAVQGVWLKLELDQAQAPLKDTFTLREYGNTV